MTKAQSKTDTPEKAFLVKGFGDVVFDDIKRSWPEFGVYPYKKVKTGKNKNGTDKFQVQSMKDEIQKGKSQADIDQDKARRSLKFEVSLQGLTGTRLEYYLTGGTTTIKKAAKNTLIGITPEKLEKLYGTTVRLTMKDLEPKRTTSSAPLTVLEVREAVEAGYLDKNVLLDFVLGKDVDEDDIRLAIANGMIQQ